MTMGPLLIQKIIDYQIDAILFAAVAFLGLALVHVYLKRVTKKRGVSFFTAAVIVLFVLLGILFVQSAQRDEEHRLRQFLQGMAPTYAEEMRRMGHKYLSKETAENDPLYLSLIEAEKKWLQVNPMAADIYTFRRREDGQIILMVDSETDYNKDGVYGDGREARTVIGEVYPDPTETLKIAFGGEVTFEMKPYVDKWGIWVSAFAPIWDDEHHVEGVLGVDYPALDWLISLKHRRAATLWFFFLPILVTLWATAAYMLQKNSLEARRRNEAGLATSVRKFQALVDLAPAGIFQTDERGHFTYVNSRWCDLAGITVSNALDTGWTAALHADDRDRVIREWHDAISTKKEFQSQYRFHTPQGKLSWVSCHAVPMRVEGGKVTGYLGAVTDLTERKQIEEELRQSEEAFRFTLLSAPVMIWMADAKGEMIYLNRYWHEFTGRPVADELGSGWHDTIFPEDRPLVVAGFKHSFAGKLEFKMEFRLRHHDGEYRWLSVAGSPRFRDDGGFMGYIGTCLDIHERKRLEAQLQQAQKMETVGTLAGGIAHDLNNQLTPLSGFLDLVLRDLPAEDPKRELLQEAEQAARRCAEVVQRLMNVSRTSNQKKVWLKMDRLLAETKKLFPKILPSTIQTEVLCDDPIWPVMGNDTELQTVLMNMAVNARDAMPNGGKLAIQACNIEVAEKDAKFRCRGGPYVLITVSDNGQGISPENIHKIFEPFFTTKAKGQGTGLGLAMVFRVVRDHGGWLDVASELNKGTTMQVYLPADPGAKPMVSSDSTVGRSMPGGNETILFADDEEPLRNLGRMFLERLGYNVILAADGEEAVKIYGQRSSGIGAVILDMTMPKLTGRQTLKQILEINPRAKVLLASGFTAEGTAKELIREGAMDFLPKPYTIFPLAQAVRRILDKTV